MSPAITPTAEQLRRAYADVCRPDWPALNTALADPVRGGLIRARAAQLAHQPRAQPPPAPTEPHGSWPFALRRTPTRPPATDAKRAAAGDTEDHQEPTP